MALLARNRDGVMLMQHDDPLELLGDRLQSLRRARKWSLDAAAESADLSAAYLSRLESGHRQPSLGTLINLSRAYGTSISSLLGETTSEVSRYRVPNWPTVESEGIKYQLVSNPSVDIQKLNVLRVSVPALRSGSTAQSHAGSEWVYVEGGAVVLTIGTEDVVLAAGQSAHFDAELPHRLSTPSVQGATVLIASQQHGANHVDPVAIEGFEESPPE